MNMRKRIALITILVIIMNLFAPYSILFKHTVQAASGVIEDNPIMVSNRGIKTVGSNRILCIQIGLATLQTINGIDFTLEYSSDLVPCNKDSGSTAKLQTKIDHISEKSEYYEAGIFERTSNTSAHTFTLTSAIAGGVDVEGDGMIPGETGIPEIDEAGAGAPGYLPIIRLYFKVNNDNITADSLPKDLFNLKSDSAAIPLGAKVSYKNASGANVSKDFGILNYNGFAEASKTVKSIAVTTPPTNTTYEHGATPISKVGGIITVTYDDETTDTVSMEDPEVSIEAGDPADANNPNVTVGYKGKTATFPITVTDPIVGLAVKTPMTNLEYTHDTALNFTGLTLEATKKSGGKVPLTQTSAGVTTDAGVSGGALKADVSSAYFSKTSPDGEVPVRGTQKIKFSYGGFDAYQTIVVNDTIASVNVVNQPTKAIYKVGETLNLAGAKVRVTLGSGNKVDINLPDGAVTVSTHNTTLVGAKQLLTATVAGKTAPETIDVEFYDYITKAEFIEPDKGEYSLGESLDLTGGRIKTTWKKTGIKNVNLTTAMVSALDTTTTGVKTRTIPCNV